MDASPTRHNPTTIFILGLVGVIGCQALAPVAWYLGTAYRAECMALDIPQDILGKTGYILGIVGTILLALSLVYVLGMTAFFVVIVGLN